MTYYIDLLLSTKEELFLLIEADTAHDAVVQTAAFQAGVIHQGGPSSRVVGLATKRPRGKDYKRIW